jgi:DNA primase
VSRRISKTVIEELKARVNVSAVVGRRIALRARGSEFIGKSPFKEEKTASFTVNDAKGFWHCFATGEHGNAIDFLMKVEGKAFREAIEEMADLAGVGLTVDDSDDRDRAKRARALQACEIATAHFEAALAGEDGGEARDYLGNRGVTADELRRYRVGFADRDSAGLIRSLERSGLDRQVARDAGLIVGEGAGMSLFRNRVMFPVGDGNGRTLGFGGRRLGAVGPKYLNSPESVVFSKRAALFNLAAARIAARRAGRFVIVEGFLDVAAAARIGIGETVATLGTAASMPHLAALWETAPEIVILFDGDEAGRLAADKVIDIAIKAARADRALRVSCLPVGSDPDDLVRAGRAAELVGAVERSIGLEEALWAREVRRVAALDSPERRARVIAGLLAAVETIEDERIQRLYHASLEARIEREFGAGRRIAADPS